RFVGEFGGDGNVDAIVNALHQSLANRGIDTHGIHPWYFPNVEEYRTRLKSQGFTVDRITLIPRPTPLPTDIRGWLKTFANPFSTALPSWERKAFFDETIARLEPILHDASGQWFADYVRLRFAAGKPLSS
ncbi:SAM-dependent methyltransferase, partial [Oscillatoriales cyanobacterium LEGE 11467]|nr:SAM-dependent methyltransferase [Zarconia navalis LEGE 11467]